MQKAAFRIVSQTGIHYRKSFLSKSSGSLPDTAPQAGDRFPWLRLRFAAVGPVEDVFSRFRDTHFHLAVIGQSAPSTNALPAGDLLRVHQVANDPGNALELARTGIPRCWSAISP